MRLIAFCEALADFRLASELVDRVLRESGPEWVADNLGTPEVIRSWHPDGFGRVYFDVHGLNRYIDQLGVRGIRGRFDGKHSAGAAMARKTFLIVRALNEAASDKQIDIVFIVWDMDHQAEERAAGVEAARRWARSWASFQIICGFPDPEREAWVLAGFEPGDDRERARLEQLCRELGFSPVLHANRLRAKEAGHLRDIKRVLRELTGEDPDREERCWIETSLETLRVRGSGTGLAAFLAEIETIMIPLLGR